MAFFDLFNHNFKLFLPELFILLTGIFILFLGAFIINIRRYKYPYLVKELHYLIIFIFTISFFLLVNNPIRNFIIFNNLLIIDDFSSSIKGIVLLATIGCLLISFDSLDVIQLRVSSFRSVQFHLISWFHVILQDVVSFYVMSVDVTCFH